MIAALDSIAGQMRDAACDPLAWMTALDSINAFVDGSGAVLLSVDERLRHAPMSSDLTEMVNDYFANGWHAIDARECCRPLLQRKGIAFDYEFLDLADIERSYGDFYPFLARHRRKYFAGLGANLDGDLWCLALQRSAAKGPFAETDLRRLHAVRSLLGETATYARLVSRQYVEGLFTAFDSDGSAAVVLDRDGRILHMNDAAQSLLTGSHLPYLGSTRAFEHFLQSNLIAGLAPPHLVKQTVLTTDKIAYKMEAVSVRNNPSLALSRASYLVRISTQAPDLDNTLTFKYGLTRTEVRVVKALRSGVDVKTMAEIFDVTTNNIRAHLKSAYAKTGTQNQIQLAGLITRIISAAADINL